MRLRCATANALWLLSSAPDAIAFRRNLDRVDRVQEALLASMTGLRVREFRERVPIRTWDEGALVPVDRVERWVETSGSSGPSKRIPYTKRLRKQFDAAIAPWIASLFSQHPRAFAGEAYWSISPGSESDEELLGPITRTLVRAVQAVPNTVRLHDDLETFRHETLAALKRCRTLSLISVWHPSFLDLLVPDDLDTEATWPQLRVISCWADANAAAPAAKLAQKFPHAKLQPKGLLSTEGFITIPYDGANVLAYRSHFFEFRDGDEVRLAHELGIGKRYEVVLTTGAGLMRYATEDLVEVLGFQGQAPILRFVGRKNHVSDHFGEKLHEIFVRERLEIALQNAPHAFAMLACDADAYVLYLESDATVDVAAIDLALRESYHYDLARRLGQLGPLRMMRVRNAAEAYLRKKASTQTLGDIKIPALDREQGWGAVFASTAIS